MEILVVILIIAVIAAVAYAVMQRQRGPAGAGAVDRPSGSPLRRRDRGVPRHDSMAAAVSDHAAATDPHDVVAAEQRLQAHAGQESARLQSQARSQQPAGYDDTFVGDPRMDGYAEPAANANGYDRSSGYIDNPSGYSAAAPTSDMHLDESIDPQTGERTDGYGDPANDPRLGDRRYDGRLAADYDPNTENPEFR